ncbi:uncharacterized protein LOC132705360 [Cylas formicarius]|uniref:uncharacterized protein LOC132705360 n=1 Tax=Cylas formicarius TaxID=197179 RepID=UPI0029587F0E|nr:uncharacterized protein LOC132705360 [Cylas formicarius]
MIEIRLKTNFISLDNKYLFAYPDSNHSPRADVAIRKYAQRADLEFPRQLTSNKLRKQIATVMQIVRLSPEEAEQFATFMGHTEKTHNEFYKLPQDLYQTAKISKLLIMMDKGCGAEYKGKSLNEININPEIECVESDCESASGDVCTPVEENPLPFTEQPSSSTDEKTLGNKKRSKDTGRSSWTENQANIVLKHFKINIKKKIAPKKHECLELIEQYPSLLKEKGCIRIKTYV